MQSNKVIQDKASDKTSYKDEKSNTDYCAKKDNAVSLQKVRFSYDGGKTWILDGIDLEIAYGQRISIIGKNGSGKSTLAKIIAGLSSPDSGIVTLCGIKVFEANNVDSKAYQKARESIGALFQSPEDQIVTTVVEDDVAFGLENLCASKEFMKQNISKALRAVNMENHRFSDPSNMSGGQQQRVAIASSIATKSKLLVLDEPTSMLDSCAKADVNKLFDKLQTRGTTIVQVTHKISECKNADRILMLENGKLRDVSLLELEEFYAEKSPAVIGSKSMTENVEKSNAENSNAESKNKRDSNKTNKNAAIEISNLSVSYANSQNPIIRDYSLSVKAGEIVAIMGKNGCGKSTLAKAICALIKYDSGSICVNGIKISEKTSKSQMRGIRKNIGYVMQLPEQQLFAQTVFEDVAYGPKNFGLEGCELRSIVLNALKSLHIEHLAQKSPFELSGGQQRLAAIAGILACNPKILVLDEPTAGLDFEYAKIVLKILSDLHNKGVTIIVITHDFSEAKALGARIVTLDSRKKKEIQEHAQDEKLENASENGSENKNKSLLSLFNTRIILISCLILMFSAFSITNFYQLGILALSTLALIFLARISPIKLFLSLHMFIAIFVFSGLFNLLVVHSGRGLFRIGPILITDDGIKFAILFASRFSLVILIGSIIVLTISQTRLTEACASIISPLKSVGLPSQEIALIMSLALRFLPTLAKEAESVALAQIARGGNIKDGSIKKRLQAITSLIVPGFASVIRHANTLGLALDSRCYVPGAKRTHLHTEKIHIKDFALLIITLGIVCGIIFAGIFI
ncbi:MULTISPECIES: energy-coupling factor transporter ATPase [Gardnerella]|uniref:Cobalt ABC transporter, ATP-binding protein n=1 Tax=Gardnerella pickettii JCP7719 TaxID=1261061 RepID=S4GW15_9BIFI|nr:MULTISPECIES: energy-coupling factor transporter ATPase [Gardnerella]EPI50021.1 cobalt ABC transporter, ATP-binding protein [Gardnerella pickettii JCP7719]EPI55245.1 cobalt ABC transporter, ATP-binding protein [Gardnerella pickettii JCP7659]KXA15338.1 cobalt ABC transporter, ATP-binding protein [Gardnerella pickettii]MDF2278015.1 energy-coupling factor transporter ATPase [Gardnerella pickettii]NSX26392.1 ATP-binding cassette domain-containing protein [Gardnerella vaginalis]